MAKKTILEFTDREIEALTEIIETIESMYGCSAEAGEQMQGVESWDDGMRREIRQIDKMLKRNGYTRA